MIVHLLKFELLQYFRNRILWIILLLISTLTLLSLFLGNQRVQQKHTVIEQLQQADEAFYAERKVLLKRVEAGEVEIEQWWQDPSNPLVIAAFGASGKHVFLEPAPLSLLAKGQSDILPYYGKVRMSAMIKLRDNVFENPVSQLKGTFDFAFVLIWLIPLMIIALSYNLLSSEREMGTMKILMSLPVSESKILLAKVIFRLILITSPIIITVIVGLFLFNIAITWSEIWKLSYSILFYCVFWFSLCTILNLTKLNSAANAVVLFGLWMVFLLIIPSVINLLANSLHPVPSRAIWITEQRAIQQETEEESHQILADFYEVNPREIDDSEVPGFYDNWNRRFLMLDVIREREKVAIKQFENPKQAQKRFVERAQFLSPPMMMNHFIERLAGTDSEQLKALNLKMEAFQKEWNAFFLPRFRNLDFLAIEDFEMIPSPTN